MITVFLDLDGVIFDFMTPYKKLLGEWEVPNKHNNFHEAIYRYSIFENLELMPNAKVLLDFMSRMESKYNLNIEILTSLASRTPEQQEEVKRQKLYCLEKNGIKYHANFVQHKGLKKWFANVKSILIDDTLANVEDFMDNNGTAIHYKESNRNVFLEIENAIFKSSLLESNAIYAIGNDLDRDKIYNILR